MLEDYAEAVRGAGTDRHDGDLGPGSRRRVRRARPTRASGTRRRWCWPAGRRRSPTVPALARLVPAGITSVTPVGLPQPRRAARRAACWWSAPRPAGSRSPTSCTAPGARSRSPSASTSACRAPTAAGTSCGGWTPRGCSTSATTRFETWCGRGTCRRCSWSARRAGTVDLNALSSAGVRLVGRLAGIRDGVAQFSGSLPNVCALADLKLGRLLDTIDAWAGGALVERFAPTVVPRRAAGPGPARRGRSARSSGRPDTGPICPGCTSRCSTARAGSSTTAVSRPARACT